jgi:hypothetical protein
LMQSRIGFKGNDPPMGTRGGEHMRVKDAGGFRKVGGENGFTCYMELRIKVFQQSAPLVRWARICDLRSSLL